MLSHYDHFEKIDYKVCCHQRILSCATKLMKRSVTLHKKSKQRRSVLLGTQHVTTFACCGRRFGCFSSCRPPGARAATTAETTESPPAKLKSCYVCRAPYLTLRSFKWHAIRGGSKKIWRKYHMLWNLGQLVGPVRLSFCSLIYCMHTENSWQTFCVNFFFLKKLWFICLIWVLKIVFIYADFHISFSAMPTDRSISDRDLTLILLWRITSVCVFVYLFVRPSVRFSFVNWAIIAYLIVCLLFMWLY